MRAPWSTSQWVLCRATCASSSSQRSRLTTGFLAAVIHPFFFHPASHDVMPFFTYSESVITLTTQGSFKTPEPLNRCRQLHAVIRCVRLDIRFVDLFQMFAIADYGRPPARAGISQTGPIGDQLNLFQEASATSSDVKK